MMENRFNDDAVMRAMAHMNQVLTRRSRRAVGGRSSRLVLAILAGHEEAMAEGFAPRTMTQIEITEAVGMRPQSLGSLIAQLEQDGCIKRVVCEDDRRAHLVVLTDKGRDEAQAARANQREFATATLAVLTDEERVQLATIVFKLNESLEE